MSITGVRSSCVLVAALLTAAAALSCLDAQALGRGPDARQRQALPIAIHASEFERFVVDIPLSPEQVNALKGAWEHYAAATAALEAEAAKACEVDLHNVLHSTTTAAEWKDLVRTHARLRMRAEQLDAQLFDAMLPILAEGQLARLERVRSRRRFDTIVGHPLLMQWLMPVHLDDLVGELELDAEVLALLEPIMQPYRDEMPRLLERVATETLEMQAKLAVEKERLASARILPYHRAGRAHLNAREAALAREVRRHIRRLVELERASCDLLRQYLTAEQQGRFERQWFGRRFQAPMPVESQDRLVGWLQRQGISHEDAQFQQVMVAVERAIPHLARLGREQVAERIELERDAPVREERQTRRTVIDHDFSLRRNAIIERVANDIRSILGIHGDLPVMSVEVRVHLPKGSQW